MKFHRHRTCSLAPETRDARSSLARAATSQRHAQSVSLRNRPTVLNSLRCLPERLSSLPEKWPPREGRGGKGWNPIKLAMERLRGASRGDFVRAYALLAPALSAELPLAQLRSEYEAMIEYGRSPPERVEVTNVLDEWSAKESHDIGWAYVAIGERGYSEAVGVIVTDRGLIRQIEWGRP
jgi:hypothetical protein